MRNTDLPIFWLCSPDFSICSVSPYYFTLQVLNNYSDNVPTYQTRRPWDVTQTPSVLKFTKLIPLIYIRKRDTIYVYYTFNERDSEKNRLENEVVNVTRDMLAKC